MIIKHFGLVDEIFFLEDWCRDRYDDLRLSRIGSISRKKKQKKNEKKNCKMRLWSFLSSAPSPKLLRKVVDLPLWWDMTCAHVMIVIYLFRYIYIEWDCLFEVTIFIIFLLLWQTNPVKTDCATVFWSNNNNNNNYY